MPILGAPDGRILKYSRLKSTESRSDRYKAVHSRSISPRAFE